MFAMVLERFGDVSNFRKMDVDVPVPGLDEVLVRVAATGINPIDAKTRIGLGAASHFTVVPPVILGWDLSGIVVAIGAEVGDWTTGDEVFGSVNFPGLGRTNAEYATVKAAHLATKPSSVSHAVAAAASMAGLTAWQALTRYRRPGPGQRVLVMAASGGVGHVAAQIAKSFGAHVTGTSSSRNRDFVLSLGVDEHIAYDRTAFENYPKGYDFVFDTLGGEQTIRSLGLMKPGGTLVTILPPREDETRLRETAAASGVHAHFHLMQSNATDMVKIGKRLDNGAISIHISKQLELTELPEAHKLIDGGRTVGKIVMTVG